VAGPPDAIPAGQSAVIGANVRALRLQRGWSLAKLGELMGWPTPSTACRAEGGSPGRQRLFSPAEIERLAGIFGVSPQQLNTGCVNCGGHPRAGFACLACGAATPVPEPARSAGDGAYLSPGQIACRFRVSTATICRLISGGELEALRDGPHLKVPVQAVRAIADPDETYLTIAETATALRVSVRTVGRLAGAEKLEMINIARRVYRIPERSVREFLSRALPVTATAAEEELPARGGAGPGAAAGSAGPARLGGCGDDPRTGRAAAARQGRRRTRPAGIDQPDGPRNADLPVNSFRADRITGLSGWGRCDRTCDCAKKGARQVPWPYPRRPDTPAIQGVYDALRGGHRHLDPDRQLAAAIEAQFPGTARLVREERDFCGRAITWAARQGIRQYVAAGAGMPPQEGQNLHDYVRRVLPGAVVAYVSSDPYVTAFRRHLLAARTPGIVAVEADLRWPYAVMTHPGLTTLIDCEEPACIMLSLVMHFAAPEQAAPIIRRFADWLVPGSCMIVSLLIPDSSPDGAEFMSLAGQAGTMYRHAPADVAGWLEEAGLETVAPGVVPVQAWPSGGWAAGRLAYRPVTYAAGAVAVAPGRPDPGRRRSQAPR